MQMERQALEGEARRGVEALQRGDFAAARDAFIAVTGSGAASPQAWLFLAQACEGMGDRTTGLSAIDQVLATDRGNPFALFMKADLFARDGDDRASVSFYRMGLRRAAELGQLPGDLADRVRRAEAAVAAAQGRFEIQLERTLAERGIDAVPPRFAEALAIASGKQPVYLQHPTSFYFPGLPQAPWYPREAFPWVSELEKAVPNMRAEIEQVLADDRGLEPYVREEAERASRGHSLLNDARWSAFHLFRAGERVEENAARCPLIMRLLELLPIPVIERRSPMALISILRPGTHIPPHHGMVKSMAKEPIIFAMANPDPEITPPDAKAARPDAIIATGRSDYPNQVNNVLGFPFIFRGALDVRATAINDEMKIAAAEALAELAREPVPEEVAAAYGGRAHSFGRDYIIPAPFDPRLMETVSSAVAEAAVRSGVAQRPIADLDAYRQELRARLNPTVSVMSLAYEYAKQNPKRVLFAEGEEPNVLRAAIAFREAGYGTPVLVGREEVYDLLKEMGVEDPKEFEVLNSRNSPLVGRAVDYIYAKHQRHGMRETLDDWAACRQSPYIHRDQGISPCRA